VAIAMALREVTNLSAFCIGNINLGAEGLKSITKIIQQNSQLADLDISMI